MGKEKVSEAIELIKEMLSELYIEVDMLKLEHREACKRQVEEFKRQGIKPEYSQLSIRAKKNKGYPTFSVGWSVMGYYDRNAKKMYGKDVAKDRNGNTDLDALKKASRGWEWEMVEGYEMRLREIRKEVKNLGKALMYLKRIAKGLEEGNSKAQEG